MQKRAFGRIDFQPSLLGFGCMRFPVLDGDNSKIDIPEAVRMVRYAIDHGVNYLDTSRTYHGGESEKVVGQILEDGYRAKVKLATKNPIWQIETVAEWDECLEQQLERLGVDFIDYYLLHAFNAESWEKFQRLNLFQRALEYKEAGKIGYIGFSFHGELSLFKEILDTYDWDFCQIQYNYLDTNYQAGTAGLRYATDKGVAVVVMEPLRGGRLATGLPPEVEAILRKAHPERTPVEWGLQWLADQPEVSVILSGMSTMEQVEQNVALCSRKDFFVGNMSAADKAVLEEAAAAWKARIKVECTDCKYCMPCPQGVNIPGCFTRLNNAAMFDIWEQEKKAYAQMIENGADASRCVSCGACEAVCPQHLEIISRLKEVDQRLRAR